MISSVVRILFRVTSDKKARISNSENSENAHLDRRVIYKPILVLLQ